MKKACCVCKIEKDYSEFGKNPRATLKLRYSCKSCDKEIRAAHHPRYRERILAYNKKWREANPDKYNSAHLKATRKYEMENKFIRKAHVAVREALKKSLIAKQSCQICKRKHGVDVKAEAHHTDYSKPLDVMWLCPKHHKAWHRVFIPENMEVAA